MNTDERPLPTRDGVHTRNGVSQDFKIRRRCNTWPNWYWIDTPAGVTAAPVAELEFDDKPPKP